MKDDYLDYAEDYGILKIEKVGTAEFYVGEKADNQQPEYIFGIVDRELEDLGVIKDEKMPEWAKEKLIEIKQKRKKSKGTVR